MDQNTLFFFNQHPEAIPLYEAFEERLLSELEGVAIQPQKSQITLKNRRVFGAVSFLPARKAKARPAPYGGGPVHFSLDGGWAAEYPPTGANAGQRCHFRGRCFNVVFTFGGGGGGSVSLSRMAGPSAAIRPHTFNSRRRILMD